MFINTHKTYKFLLLWLLCFPACSAKHFTIPAYQLYGPVKQLSLSYFTVQDSAGDLYPSHDIISKKTLKFNTDHKITEILQLSSSGSFSFKASYLYDTASNTISIKSYNHLGAIEATTILLHTPNWQLIKMISSNNESTEGSMTTYQYNTQGLPMSDTIYTLSGIPDIVTQYFYQPDGLVRYKKSYNLFNQTNYQENYVYNNQQQLLEVVTSLNNGTVPIKVSYRYKKDLCVGIIYSNSYNAKPLEEKIIYTQFDSYGNWTMARCYENSTLLYFMKRSIVYYKSKK
ncbi:MAG: hypothetical protein QM528_08270 [Phycisphaerales bacterium]|nr:hypothetical protein [Phycisphaerales bacterium]